MIIDKNKSLLYIVIIALCVYAIVNFIYFPIGIVFGDEERFIREAIGISTKGEFANGSDRAWEMPLTAIVYSFFYSLFETEKALIISVRVFQPLLLILQAFLLYKLAIKIFKDEISAIITLVIVLFYPFFVFYQGLLLSETIFNTSIIMAFYFIYKWYENDFKIDHIFLFANLFLVLSLYVKGTLSILPPILLTLFYLINTRKVYISIKVLILSTILYSMFLSPWWLRNYMVFDSFIPFTTSSGKVLYLGNNPANQFGGCDMAKDVDLKIFAEIASIKDELKRSNVYKQEAIEFIKNNPERFFELMILKLKRFYNIVPNAEQYNQGYFKWITLLSYGPIFILFLVSIVIHLKYWKSLSAIYILILYFTLIHMIFIASLRYRLPLEPFMILLSSNILAIIYRRLNAIKNR